MSSDTLNTHINALWSDRKRILGMPISFTKYTLGEDRLFCERGLLTTVHDEITLFRVRDVRVTRTLWQKIFGVGTVTVFSADKSNPQFPIESVKNPLGVKEALVKQVEDERRRNNIRSGEMIVDNGHDCAHEDEDEWDDPQA